MADTLIDYAIDHAREVVIQGKNIAPDYSASSKGAVSVKIIKDGILVVTFLFLGVGIATAVGSVNVAVHWLVMLRQLPGVIALNRATTGMPGLSVASFVFVYMGINWLKGNRDLTYKEQDVLTQLIKISLIAMVAVPLVTYWSARIYLTDKNYKVCDPHPRYRIHAQDAVYVLDTEDCPYGYTE